MKGDLGSVKYIGFDLDQTLYPDSQEMQSRVRNKIAERILKVKPVLETIEEARSFFEERYAKLQSGTKVLKEVGYEKANIVMDACLAEADVLELIAPNNRLVNIMERIAKSRELYLLTSCPEELALEKLAKIGISSETFEDMFFGDTQGIGSKSSGKAFDYAIRAVGGDPAKHMYVGDRLSSDIRPANERGMTTVAVWNEISEADVCIPTINDLGDLFR